jgi:hypothetical protein
MAKMNMTIEHELSESEALKRIKKLLKETKEEYGELIDELKEKWVGNIGTFSLMAKGYELSGTIVVGAPTITLQGDIPWALSFMKGKVEKIIRSRAKELLR